jgi:hypothetical protein
MKQTLFLLLLIFGLHYGAQSQDPACETNKSKFNTIYIEGFGTSLGVTLNYERIVPFNQDKIYGSVGGGLGLVGFYFAPKLQANLLFGHRNFFELGMAGLIIEQTVGPALKVGYRFQRFDKSGLSFQANVVAIFLGDDFLYLPGVALGYSF